jgi:hypothetical protein
MAGTILITLAALFIAIAGGAWLGRVEEGSDSRTSPTLRRR